MRAYVLSAWTHLKLKTVGSTVVGCSFVHLCVSCQWQHRMGGDAGATLTGADVC